MKRLPPYARPLAERQRFTNLPFLVIVCIGKDCWSRAKKWNQSPNDIAAMVCTNEPPDKFCWPVSRCDCIVDWHTGPSERQIVDLVSVLLRNGAESVTVRPLFVDISSQIWEYKKHEPIGERWVQNREYIKTYNNPLSGGFQYVA